VAGDDLRHVDWKVWARQDRLYIKQYEEETNLRCTLIVDGSASMNYGRGPLNKYEYAATLASSLAYLVLRQQDAVGCAVFDEQIRMRVPSRTRRSHLQSVIDTLAVSEPRQKTDPYAILHQVAESFPRRGMMVLVSDLLVDAEQVIRGLKLLRQRGHDVLVFHLLDDDELDFPFDGPVRFEGLESLNHLNCKPRALREGYLQALQAHLERIRRGCSQHTIDYALIRTSQPLDAVLATYLSTRLGMHRKN